MNEAYHITDLVQRYQDGNVLEIKDYTFEKNKITALVGPNGSGKSTLLDILAFVSKPVEGSVTTTFRHQLAYLQQRPYLFNMSVEKNIGIGLKLRGFSTLDIKKRVDALMDDFNLTGLKHRRGHSLSGGEVQKVALARSVILEPKVLILDEPFSHLDKSSKNEIEVLIRNISQREDQTMIFSTHDHYLAQTMADNVCTLINGRLMPTQLMNVFNGTVDDEARTFNTGLISIHIPSGFTSGSHLAVDSSHLVLSRQPLDSSMRNSFQGRIQGLSEDFGNIQVTVSAGEKFQVLITADAWKELDINIGDDIWLSFKSTAVSIF